MLIGLLNFAISRRIASVENRIARRTTRRRPSADEIAAADPMLTTTGLGQNASER